MIRAKHFAWCRGVCACVFVRFDAVHVTVHGSNGLMHVEHRPGELCIVDPDLCVCMVASGTVRANDLRC